MTKTHSDKPTSAKLPIELEARLKKASKSSRVPVSAFITIGVELVMEHFEKTGRLPDAIEAREDVERLYEQTKLPASKLIARIKRAKA